MQTQAVWKVARKYIRRRRIMDKRMIFRKALFLAALCMAAVVCIGCQKKTDQGSQVGPDDGKFKIGYIVDMSDMWHNLTGTLTKRYIESQRDDMTVTLMDYKGKAETFLQQMEIIAQGGYGMAMGGVPNISIAQQVNVLKEKNCAFIAYAIKMEESDGLYSTFMCDEFDLGFSVADRAAKDLPPNAQVVILNGIAGYNGSIYRRRGFQEGLLDARPDVKLLDEQTADFQKSIAMEKMDDWIQRFGNVDGVLAANDGMALGAIESLRANGKDIRKVYVYGIDSLADACLSIDAGELRASALQDSMSYAKAFLDRAIKLKNKEVDAYFVEDLVFKPVLTDSSNVKERLAFYEENGVLK
jgi:inositol transport system substrate-binding protein